MLNFSVWHNGATVCSLLEVLESGSIPSRYFLSPKACAGILRRAEKRGKSLPEPLRVALEAVAFRGQTRHAAEHYSQLEFIPEVSSPLMAQANETGGDRPPGSTVDTVGQPVAQALRGEGFDASEDGTGRGTPIVPVGFRVHGENSVAMNNLAGTANVADQVESVRALDSKGGYSASQCGNIVMQPIAVNARQDPDSWSGRIGPLDSLGSTHAICQAIPFDTTQIMSPGNWSVPKAGDACHPLAATAHIPAIAFRACGQDGFKAGEQSPPLCASDGGGTVPTVAYQCQGSNVGEMGALRAGNGNESGGVPFVFQTRCSRNDRGLPSEVVPALTSCEGGSHADTKPHVAGGGYVVRRLLPIECERLMGFPDGWTLVKYRGKPATDGPRYKAIGNSWAIPCVRWIGERIDAFVKGMEDSV
jgi:DNA (cytosine-5)-methyltransferase 1